MSSKNICGCKGIRTCLLCEKQSDDPTKQRKTQEPRCVFVYCPGCNMCWPNDEETAKSCDFPFYIGKIKLYHDFFSEEEETSAMSAIDKIPWMPSQSGRKKQDFGPKVNFKKKKVKIGDFKGFPGFTENTLQKFQEVPELFDFKPVELCHLDYSPDRGSSIDPHVDDFWLWGERLVTVNLGSSTVLTLVPCSENACDCLQEAKRDFQSCTFCKEHLSKVFSGYDCQDISTTNSMKNLFVSDAILNVNNYSENLLRGISNSVSDATNEKSAEPSASLVKSTSVENPTDFCQLNPKTFSLNNLRNFKLNVRDKQCLPSAKTERMSNTLVTLPSSSDQLNFRTFSLSDTNSFDPNKTICCAFRNNKRKETVAVRIHLPPRSLFVLAGCARYNWFHEIKRQDVVSRRLAMTFRELTAEFLDGGKESKVGKDLLEIARTFYDS